MNTKGTKFLAILAVMAMAFAAFAVIAPAEANDATTPSSVSGKVITVGDDITTLSEDFSLADLEVGYYYIETTSLTMTIPKGVENKDFVFFVLSGVTLNLSVASDYDTATAVSNGLVFFSVTKDASDKLTVIDQRTNFATFVNDVALKTIPTAITTQGGSFGDVTLWISLNAAGDSASITATDAGTAVTASGYYKAGSLYLAGNIGNVVNLGTGAVWYLNGVTGTIYTTDSTTTFDFDDPASVNTIKVTKFTGTIGITNAGLITIAAWDSGDVEIVTAATAVTLQSYIPSGCTLYVDATAPAVAPGTPIATKVVTADSDFYDGTATANSKFINNGTISIKQVKNTDGIVGVGTFTLAALMINNGVINNMGVFDQVNKNITNAGKIITGNDVTATAADATGTKVQWAVVDAETLVINNGTFTFKETTAGSNVVFATTSFGNVINQVAKNKDVAGTITNDTYGWDQSATITGDTVLTGLLNLQGLLVINEGVTLTIENGGAIALQGPQSMIKNNGTIVIAGETIPGPIAPINVSKGTVVNNGTIDVENPVALSAAKASVVVGVDGIGIFQNNGVLNIESGVFGLTTAKSIFINGADASVIIEGQLASNGAVTLFNAGSILINGEKALHFGAESTIALINSSASVVIDVVGFGTDYGLKIDNAVLWFADTTKEYSATNVIDLAALSDDHTPLLIHDLQVVPYTVNKKAAYLSVSGDVRIETITYGDMTDTYTIALAGTEEYPAVYIEDLILQKGVLLSVADYTDLVFYGTTEMINGASASIRNNVTDPDEENNSITVTGMVIIDSARLAGVKVVGTDLEPSPFDAINATMYSIKVGSITTNYYTTFDRALASADIAKDKTITATGENKIASDLTIPAGVTVNNQGDLIIDEGKTLTVENGGLLKNSGVVYVNGTMYAEVAKNVTGQTNVISDVKVVGAVDARWTNLANALANAEVGDTVIITKDTGVVLTKNTTIPLGVTLDTNEKSLMTYVVEDDEETHYTLTVNGTLVLYAAGTFDSYNDVVLNGYIVSDDQRTYTNTGITGAYFSDQIENVDYYYIAGVKNLGDITASGITTVGVYGDISVPALAFAGADDAATVTFYNNVGGTAITASNAVIIFSAGDYVKATITDGTNSVALNGDVPAAKTLTLTLGDKFKVAGDFQDVTVEANKFVFKTAGTVTLDALNLCALDVAGTATVNNTVTVDNTVVVSGTLVIAESKKLLANDASAMVTGSIDSAGVTKLKNITIGSSTNAVAAAATVAGDVTAEVIVLFAGNVVAESIVEDMKYTQFFVDGKLWFTVYSNGEVDLAKITVPVTDGVVPDATLSGDLKINNGKLAGTFTPGDKASFDIAVKYDIYKVRIYTDAGVKSVAINGIELQTGYNQNYFETVINLEAGTYTVTCTLASGYSGESTLSVYDTHTVLKDNKFVLSGFSGYDPEKDTTTGEISYVLKLQLTGTEQSVAPEPSPVEEKEWTITTILLLVLVILIAVMAVIVALRLNRN